MNKQLLSLLFPFLLFSCSKQMHSEAEVYTNDFESGNTSGIGNAAIESYNGTKVLGRYNNSGFSLHLDNLPKHSLVQVSFDLYIHDSWDGNSTEADGIGGPDIWQMSVDGTNYIRTTFSNSPCGAGVFCPPQSYPADYLSSRNNPKTGAYQTDLPGVCYLKGQQGGTSLYKIVKTIRHTGNNLLLECKDELIQMNTTDPKCDESWSVDNIKIKVINVD